MLYEDITVQRFRKMIEINKNIKIKNKKGIALSFTMGWVIFLLIFILIILGALAFMINVGQTNIFETTAVANFVYVDAMFNAKNGIMKYDEEIGRVYPNIVSHFDSIALDNSLYFEEKENEIPAARLMLKNLETGNEKEIYWNREWYERLAVKSALKGGAVPVSYETVRLVKEEVDGKLVPSKLTIKLLIPKRMQYEKNK